MLRRAKRSENEVVAAKEEDRRRGQISDGKKLNGYFLDHYVSP
jgi:hypothetical protein